MKKGIDYIGVSVVFFCHDRQGRFIMQKRSSNCKDENGRWDIGAGAIEHGERILDALSREIKEEYKTTKLHDVNFLGMREVHRVKDGKPDHWIGLDYKVLVNPEDVGNGEPEKIDEVRWFTLNKLPSPVHSQLPYFLEKYRDVLG